MQLPTPQWMPKETLSQSESLNTAALLLVQLADLLRLTQVTVMALKAEIQVLPTLTQRGALVGQLPGTAASYLENKNRLLLFREHEDPSIKTRVQRAVDATLSYHLASLRRP